MENKQFTTQESLALITKMIDNTRRNFNSKGGQTMMLWGYTTIAVSLAVYLCVKLTHNPMFFWLWWALPVIGITLTLIAKPKRNAGVKTYMDRMVDYIWLVFSIACGATVIIYSVGPLFTGKEWFNVLLVVGIIMSMSVTLTGLFVKFRPLVIAGMAGTVLSLLLPPFGQLEQTLGLGIIFMIVMAIPGHMLNFVEKREKKSMENV